MGLILSTDINFGILILQHRFDKVKKVGNELKLFSPNSTLTSYLRNMNVSLNQTALFSKHLICFEKIW